MPLVPIKNDAKQERKASRKDHAVIRMHLWLESTDGVLFGMGRLLLLREIKNCGSLTAAAANLGMSYRGAWGKIKKTEELLGQKIIERQGCRRSGYRLTEFGEDLSERFEEWFSAVERFALEKGNDILPLKPESYSGRHESDLQRVKYNILK